MKKGIQKFIISFVASILFLMPFSIVHAETDLDMFGAYMFWRIYGYDTMSSNEIYSVGESIIRVPEHYTYLMSGSKYFSGFECIPYNNAQSSSAYACHLKASDGSVSASNILYMDERSYNITQQGYNVIKQNNFYFTRDGNFPSFNSFDVNAYSNSLQSDIYILSFLSSQRPWSRTGERDSPYFFPQNGTHSDYHVEDLYRYVYREPLSDGTTRIWCLWTISISTDNANTVTIAFPPMEGLDVKIIPIYFGKESMMSDEQRRWAGLGTLLDQGNTESQASTNAADQSNQSLGTSVQNLSTIEDQYNQDLNTQLNQIDFTDHITTQQGFLSSSSWVINTFNTLIANNPFTWLIVIVSIFYVFKRFN